MPQRFITTLPWWLPALIIAIALRAVVLASGTVSFHSDEAIVGLMARHINQAQSFPTFFYGQHYMGSLDPLLVAGAFRLFGESVLSIRLVQAALYLCVVATTMILALRITGSRWIAGTAGLLVAVPPVVMTLYTTVSLGGYSETLVIGNLLLLVSYEIASEKREAHPTRWLWFALGALIGLGWWTNSLIVAYVPAVVVRLIGYLIRRWRRSSKQIVSEELLNFSSALIGFIIFSGPWWLYNLNHDWASVRFLVGGFQPAGSLLSVGIGDRLIGLLLLGLPAVIGARYSWSMTPWMGVWVIPFAIVYGGLLAVSLPSRAVRFLWALVVGFAAIFVGSSFGVDATGRYLLPLIVPLAIIIAAQIHALRQRFELAVIRIGSIALLIGVNLLGTVIAMRTLPPGLTPQFDAATDFPNGHDQAVIDFLLENGGQYGYATYWATYRLAFLSGERVTLTPMLPYKATLVYTPTDRYPPYTAAVEQAERPVFVTANLPRLDSIIAERLRDKSITFSQRTIGPFTVFYHLSQRVTPLELGLQSIAEG